MKTKTNFITIIHGIFAFVYFSISLNAEVSCLSHYKSGIVTKNFEISRVKISKIVEELTDLTDSSLKELNLDDIQKQTLNELINNLSSVLTVLKKFKFDDLRPERREANNRYTEILERIKEQLNIRDKMFDMSKFLHENNTIYIKALIVFTALETKQPSSSNVTKMDTSLLKYRGEKETFDILESYINQGFGTFKALGDMQKELSNIKEQIALIGKNNHNVDIDNLTNYLISVYEEIVRIDTETMDYNKSNTDQTKLMEKANVKLRDTFGLNKQKIIKLLRTYTLTNIATLHNPDILNVTVIDALQDSENVSKQLANLQRRYQVIEKAISFFKEF